jgi:hypothetical protein
MTTSKKRFVWLLIGMVGVVLTVSGHAVLMSIGVVLTLAALMFEYRTEGAVVVPFVEAEWVHGKDGFLLEVSRERHGRRNPTATVWQRGPKGDLQEIICEVNVTGAGDVVLGASEGFDGQARIS